MTDLFAAEYAANSLPQGDCLTRGLHSAIMDSCELVRKETQMEVVHLNP